MKKYVVKCTEEIKYEFIVEAHSQAHAQEIFYNAGQQSQEIENDAITGADFNIDSIEEIN